MDVPPSVLRVGPPFSNHRSTESDGAWSLVDTVPCFAPSEPMVSFVTVEDAHRLRTVARNDGNNLRRYLCDISNSMLIDWSWWIRLMASASSGATDNDLILGRRRSSANGMLSVMTTESTGAADRR